jgi:hypothetical protein
MLPAPMIPIFIAVLLLRNSFSLWLPDVQFSRNGWPLRMREIFQSLERDNRCTDE